MEYPENFIEAVKKSIREKTTEAEKVKTSFYTAEFVTYLFATNDPEMSRRRIVWIINALYKRFIGRQMTRKDYSLIMSDYENQPADFFETEEGEELSDDKINKICLNYERLEFFGKRRMASRLLKTAPKSLGKEYIHRRPSFFRTGTSVDRSK